MSNSKKISPNSSERSLSAGQPSSPEAALFSRKPTILIIDDDAVFVELLTDELQPHFLVEWARDGRTAIDSIIRQSPDAIFLDHTLPDTTGIYLMDDIRRTGCDAPVVMLTASQDVRIATAAMRAGAVDFIVKDVKEDFYESIVPTATRAIEKWNNEKELEYLREQQQEQAQRTSLLNDQLKQKNQQLERAYQEIEASHQQLRQKNKRLSELYETAHRFVDNVSHEMRTPLTVIKEFLSITLDGLAGPLTESQQEYLNIATAKTNDLAQMVEDMLDISKIEAGLLRVNRQICQLPRIVSGIDQVLRQKSKSCRVQLSLKIPENIPELYCDPEKVGRTIINLVINAMKFSAEESEVILWADRGHASDEIQVGVTDHGPGIAAEHLQVIFERFKQVGKGTRSSTKGFGLGLNIVRELVYLNLGDIQVQSELGHGSTFSFSIPVFDRRLLIQRLLNRLHILGHQGRRLILVRAYALQPVEKITGHIRDFLEHNISSMDLVFERATQNDVVIVALTDDAHALTQRLLVNNQEELRLSPGSTIDLRFDVLNDWKVTDSRTHIIDTFVSLFEATPSEPVHVR